MLILKIVAAVLNITLLLIIVEGIKLEFSKKEVPIDAVQQLFKQAVWVGIVLNILVQVMINTGV